MVNNTTLFKTISKTIMGLGLSFSFLLLSVNDANAAVEEKTIRSYYQSSNMKVNDSIIKPNYFNELLKKHEVKKSDVLKYEVSSKDDMYKVLVDIDEKMPSKIELKSPIYSKDELNRMFDDMIVDSSVEELSNFKNLFVYRKVKTYGKTLILNDEALPGGSVQTVFAAYNEYVDLLSKQLKGPTESESLLNIYHYVYNNFEYTANSARNMYITNIGNGKMACNGLSRLMNDLMIETGISSAIRQGESHFWNIATIDGQSMTVDVTTDILKNKPFFTIGASSKEHKELTLTTGLYNADFDVAKYEEIKEFKNFK
ncbi:hypothetical protein [Lysinibacillus fusiformis]|uniref:hypothetical protein n=1 Tax=Lysinibacillus fusiformis TaxID=28031 RepID=UPI0021BEF36C|nr:hypothetical protein [Lysinibacillus fusiformis]UXJ71311.1 hypothetical protein N5069_24040 [Lysinibacillus fusiformis]